MHSPVLDVHGKNRIDDLPLSYRRHAETGQVPVSGRNAVFVIAIGWYVYFKLIGSGEASKVASFTFLIPVVSILISVLFLNEQVTTNLIIGILLVLASILLVNAKMKHKQRRPS